MTTLVVHFRGGAANTGRLYVRISDTEVTYDDDPADSASTQWIRWETDLISAGADPAAVKTLTVGIEGGQAGTLFVNDIQFTKP